VPVRVHCQYFYISWNVVNSIRAVKGGLKKKEEDLEQVKNILAILGYSFELPFDLACSIFVKLIFIEWQREIQETPLENEIPDATRIISGEIHGLRSLCHVRHFYMSLLVLASEWIFRVSSLVS